MTDDVRLTGKDMDVDIWEPSDDFRTGSGRVGTDGVAGSEVTLSALLGESATTVVSVENVPVRQSDSGPFMFSPELSTGGLGDGGPG